jgi:DNA-binding transcriptional LysR family regulator
LTAIGEILATHGRTIVKEGAQALAAAKHADAPRGVIRISMPAGIADEPLIPMLASFLDRYPAISIDAIATDRLLDLVSDRIDVAFRVDGVEDGPFIARTLVSDHNVFVASPAYLERAPSITKPADLTKHPLIGFAGFGKRQTFQLEGPGGVRLEIEMDCRVTSTSGLAIKHWALSGVGVARFPRCGVASEIKSRRLVHVLPDYASPSYSLSVIYMPERFRPASARRLIDHAVQYFAAHGRNPGSGGMVP